MLLAPDLRENYVSISDHQAACAKIVKRRFSCTSCYILEQENTPEPSVSLTIEPSEPWGFTVRVCLRV